MPLAHLDRPFDYAVPAAMADAARARRRVKVRFAGQDVDGYVVARVATSDHPGRLAPLRRVVSAEPVLAPQVAALTADARRAVRRHPVRRAPAGRPAAARDHREASRPRPSRSPRPSDAAAAEAAWAGHDAGAAFLRHLADGWQPARGVGRRPGDRLAGAWSPHAAAATYAGGRGALVVRARRQGRRPGRRRAHRGPRARASTSRSPPTPGPAGATATSWPSAAGAAPGRRRHPRRGLRARSTTSGLVVIWDDGDDLHAEPRAPYPHTRETLLLRAEREGAAALVGGFVRTVEARVPPPHRLGPRARRRPATVLRERVTGLDRRRHRPRPRAATRSRARPGSRARCTTRSATRSSDGPVLVQTPRLGYAAALACERCRTPARCAACQGRWR